jgi:hypothetical protein
MPSIRKTKTASGATAVQVVCYEHRKVVVLKHIGSATTDEELAALRESAAAWIAEETRQQSLFRKESRRTLPLATARYTGVTHHFAHEVLENVANKLGFMALKSPLLLDLALLRMIEPTSKLRAITLMERYFAIRYAESTVYRILPLLAKRKVDAEQIAVAWAKKGLSSDLALVLYDVTTLYFETFTADELRTPGFSKDNKSQQPQIVVGLLVTREGFPLGYEVFKGNTFEGKTMLPVLETFARRHGVTTPTVVADAAMISRENVLQLTAHGFSYIVGARLANCSASVIAQVRATLAKKDGATMRVASSHGDLVCAFSAKRYRKDKAEMQKQIAKAEALVARGEPGKRAKFVKKSDDDSYMLDEALRKKAASLLGMKGYYTNIPKAEMGDDVVIARYADLWHVEAAFRMSKNDLATRPIFHRTEDAIKAHLLICFIALAIGKHMELHAGLSLRRIVDLLWSVTEAHIADTATTETFTLRSEPSKEVMKLLKKLGCHTK